MYSITLFLLAFFSLYIGAFGLFRWDASFLRQGDTPFFRILIILTICIFLFYALVPAYRKIRTLSPSAQKKLSWILFLFMVAGQVTFLLCFRPALRYDALKTFDQAVEMLSTHTISATYENGYFARYTNNYPITILTYWILSLGRRLGLGPAHDMLLVQILNLVLLDISLLMGFRLLKKLRTPHISLFYLLLCAVCPSTYVWGGFFYTSSLSMPFFLGILLIYFRMKETALLQADAAYTDSDRAHRRLIPWAGLGFLLGIFVIMGFKFRATAFIALIAVVITVLYEIPWRTFLSWLKSFGKRLITCTASFLLACILTLTFWQTTIDRYVPFDYQNTGFPAIHWVMMGMRWDGAYDLSDESYTSSFPTKEEKSAAAMERLLERIKEAGPGGMISLMSRKLLNTWVDGTDTYQEENSALTDSGYYTRLYDYLLGTKDGLLLIYVQAFRVLQMLTLGFSALLLLIRIWKSHKEKQKPDAMFALQLALLGGMGFHLIWETNPLYSLSFLFLTMILMADQLALLLDNFPSLTSLGRKLCPIGFAALLLFLILGHKQLVDTPIEEHLYSVNQYQYNDSNRTYVQEYEEIYVQTFVTDKPFNRIAIDAINPVGNYNQSAFQVSLTDDQGNVLYYNDRFLSGLVVKNELYEFELDLIVPDGPTTYTLSLAPGYIHGEDSLQFRYYCTENYDLYPAGTLSIGGKEQKNGDLAFAVYEYHVTTYFNIKVYLLLAAALLVGCGWIIFLNVRRRK